MGLQGVGGGIENLYSNLNYFLIIINKNINIWHWWRSCLYYNCEAGIYILRIIRANLREIFYCFKVC